MEFPPPGEAQPAQEIATSQEAAQSNGEEIKPSRPTAEDDNKFQQAIAAWRNVDLTGLIPKLDATATDVVEHQRVALEQRKDLAQKTRDFRKLDDTGKLAEYKALLKAYQSFIDVVTNQSKAVQAAFLQVYSPLSEAPDPYPLLEASIEGLITADETLPKLVGEKEHLEKTVTTLTSQLEELEDRLQQERATRQDAQHGEEDRIKEVERRWEAVLQEKQGNWESKERNLEDKIENQERLLKELKANYEVSQRLGKGDDESTGASGVTAAELEIVSSELDRAHTRLAEVETRNEQLRLELAQSASQRSEQTPVEDDPAYLRLQSENASLARRFETLRYEKDTEKKTMEANLKILERDVTHLKAERDATRDKVRKWGDYESIKSELEVLKKIEFATGDDDENDAELEAATKENGSKDPSKRESLEQLLLARNKKLSNELTLLRVSHNELKRRLDALQEDHSTANAQLEKSKSLTATLENDLLKVQQEAANAFDAKSVAGTYTSRYPASTYRSTRAKGSSPTSSIISGFDPTRSSSPGTLESLRAGEPVGGGSGILPMVTAQRDRFKKKNNELEAELQTQHQTVSSLRAEIAGLQKDNLSLYEKTRYIGTYTSSAGPAQRSTYTPASPGMVSASATSYPTGGPYGGSAAGGVGDDRYHRAYESHISPFSRFRSSESARAMKRMSYAERVIWQITRMVLATRTSRNLFAGYCVALHLMVLMMLYWMGSISPVPNLGEAAALGGGAALAGVPAGDVKAAAAAGDAGWQQEAAPKGG